MAEQPSKYENGAGCITDLSHPRSLRLNMVTKIMLTGSFTLGIGMVSNLGPY